MFGITEKNSIFKDNSRIQMFGRIKQIPVSGKIRKEHKQLKKMGEKF